MQYRDDGNVLRSFPSHSTIYIPRASFPSYRQCRSTSVHFTMARSTRVHLFGDQMTGFDGGLRRLFQIQDNPLLSSFFERTHHALRLEIGQLSLAERAFFPRFTSISDLLARYRDSGNNPALESAFTCIHQLACFIRQVTALQQLLPA